MLPHYSVTRIQDCLECPYKFKRYHIDKVKQGRSKYTSFGLTIEDSIEEVYNNPEVYQNLEDSQIYDLLDRYWVAKQYQKEYTNDIPTFYFLGYSSKQEEDQYKKDGFNYIKEYFKYNKIEKQFAFELPFEVTYKKWLLKGRIDHIKQLNGELYLIDNKVSDKIIMDMETSLQLGLYLYAMRVLQPKLKITHIGYYYIKLNKLSLLEVDKVKLKDILNTIEQTCLLIEAGIFNPTKNKYCYFCQFKDECSVN